MDVAYLTTNLLASAHGRYIVQEFFPEIALHTQAIPILANTI